MTPERIAELRAVAAAATPGPIDTEAVIGPTREDERFMATFSPGVVMDLLCRVEALRAERELIVEAATTAIRDAIDATLGLLLTIHAEELPWGIIHVSIQKHANETDPD